MTVSCTYSPGFGVKITVGLPRHVGREAGFELCDAIDALIPTLALLSHESGDTKPF